MLSNGKDQAMKLWDVRRMSATPSATLGAQPRRHWDYRMEYYPNSRFRSGRGTVPPPTPVDGDMSVMTYHGHRVLRTLIRCYFSPQATTGQRYVYTGSHDGSCYIYDVLSGELVDTLHGHQGVLRDVSWHPTLPTLITSSWDKSIAVWEHTRV